MEAQRNRNLQKTLSIKKMLTPFTFQVSEKFNFSRPTQVEYSVDSKEDESFTGSFAEIRKSRDFEYHGNYTAHRQELQDALLQDVIGGATSNRESPWIVFTAGAMGAGKSHVIHWMSREGHFPLPDIIQVDPDQFRSRLPEWKGYLSRNPDTAGKMTHRECGYLVEIAQEAALRQKKHVWVDGSLRDSTWYSSVFKDIRKRHPSYRIAILHITASLPVVMERAAKRAEVTGRVVPHADLVQSFEMVPKAVNELCSEADFLAVVSNEPNSPPRLIKFCNEETCSKLPGDDWSELQKRFALVEHSMKDICSKHQGLFDKSHVVILGKSFCSQCTKLGVALSEAGHEYYCLELDKDEFGLTIEQSLSKLTLQMAAPFVFVKGKFIGDCDSAMAIIESGELQTMLNPNYIAQPTYPCMAPGKKVEE